jgi:transcriptional regulator with XRE-family HTH domain
MEKKYNKALDRIKDLKLGSLPNLRDALPQTPMTAGQLIRAMRKNFGFTIAEVARLTDIGETNLSAIETDSKEIGVLRATRLAAVFGIDPAHLLFPNGFSIHGQPELEEIADQAQRMRKQKAAAG